MDKGELLLRVEGRRRATRGEGLPFSSRRKKEEGTIWVKFFTSGTLLNKICTWLPLHLCLASLPYCCGALTRYSSALEREQRRAYGETQSLNALLDVAHVEPSFWSWGLLHERKKPRSCVYYACQRTVRLLRHLQNKKKHTTRSHFFLHPTAPLFDAHRQTCLKSKEKPRLHLESSS